MRTPALNRAIAKRIKQLLGEQKRSVESLALAAGVSKSFLYGFLKGTSKEGNISVNTLKKLADALDVEVKDLFGA